MSRSTRKSPVCGITAADSEKANKAANHREFRRAVRVAPNQGADLFPRERELVNPWSQAKTRARVPPRRERARTGCRETVNVTSIKKLHIEVPCRVTVETVVSPGDGRVGPISARGGSSAGRRNRLDRLRFGRKSAHRRAPPRRETGGSRPRARRKRAIARFWYSPCLRRPRLMRPRCGRVGPRVPPEPRKRQPERQGVRNGRAIGSGLGARSVIGLRSPRRSRSARASRRAATTRLAYKKHVFSAGGSAARAGR